MADTHILLQGGQVRKKFALKDSEGTYVGASSGVTEMEVLVGGRLRYLYSTEEVTIDSSTPSKPLWTFLITQQQSLALAPGTYTITCRPKFNDTDNTIPPVLVGFLKIVKNSGAEVLS